MQINAFYALIEPIAAGPVIAGPGWQRSHDGALRGSTMEDLAVRISRAKDLDELIPLIEAISQETENVLGKRELKEGDIERILVPLEVMRTLLGKLDLLLPSLQDLGQATRIRELAVRCLDLEGKLKERRNDLLRPRFAA